MALACSVHAFHILAEVHLLAAVSGVRVDAATLQSFNITEQNLNLQPSLQIHVNFTLVLFVLGEPDGATVEADIFAVGCRNLVVFALIPQHLARFVAITREPVQLVHTCRLVDVRAADQTFASV